MPRRRPHIPAEIRRKSRIDRAVRKTRAAMMREQLEGFKKASGFK